MFEVAKKIAAASAFRFFITAIILVACALAAIETYPEFEKKHHALFAFLERVVIAVFSVEVAVKILAEGRQPWRYFQDGWNIFDFLITAACYLPYDNQYVTLLRLLRLLRALRLLSAFPKLQILVMAIFKSLPSMGYVWLLMAVLFFVFGVAGVMLFGKNDPLHFGTLTSSALSLFQVSTLDSWIELLNIQLYGCDKIGYEPFKHLCTSPQVMPWAPAYFIAFILSCVFILVNLFIGIVLNSMEEAREELAELNFRERDANPREADRRRAEAAIEKLNASLKVLQIKQVKYAEKEPKRKKR